ncbi:hypothetical protein [Vibrio sp. B1FLJ16]|uniref:hypothetical protein n=1 Tax=Vibrio sp. B1FLJ16 TaxID=2751178 RepID=UPI0015F6166D|nr:hypothetical protein [Vibrio sp. B1FLJ16]CAD7819988.1 hypothetical protein ACOMICROBIO_EPCKBFOG_03776 [Vibrio sp. B1FLJ16]CAE6941381.1 hypothetical protein ACOMICROBIO_EPCKBFOG_03776 [Vibrio sp. B1FLJ16]
MRRLISCSALVIACLTLSGCWLEDDDPEGNNVNQIVDTPQSDDTTGDDDNADSGENSDTDDNTRSDDTANDDSTGSDDTTGDDDSTDSGDPVYVGNPTGSGDTDDTDDSTDSDDNSDTNDNTRSGGTVDNDDTTGSDDTADTDDTTDSDDTADTDDPADSDDTADTDEPTDSDDTADTDDPTDSDDTADTDDPTDSDDSTDSDDTATITKYQWRSPVLLYDADTPPNISSHDDQVITTWYQDLEIWASVGTDDDMENAQIFNVSKSGKVLYFYANPTSNTVLYEQIRPTVSNSKGETCTVWAEKDPYLVRAACYSSTSGSWSEPLTLNEEEFGFFGFRGFKMVALSDDRFAIVFNYNIASSKTDKILLAIFTPSEVQQRSIVESDLASSQITVTPNDSAGFNLLYTSVHPTNGTYNRLLLSKIDAELNLTTTVLDERYTTKSHLLLTSGDNPALSYVSSGNVKEMYILDSSLTEIDIGDARLTPYRYHSLVSTSDGALHFSWQTQGLGGVIRHIIVKDKEVTTTDTTRINEQQLRSVVPQLIADGDKIYMYWLVQVTSGSSGKYAITFSHYIDEAWTEPSTFTCGEGQECFNYMDSFHYAITDDIIAIAYRDEEGGKIVTTAKEAAVEEE